MAKSTKTIKCNIKYCAIVQADNEPKIRCKSHCKGEFHGSCLGLHRHWSATTTSTTKFFIEHFICDDCIKLPDILLKVDDLWSKKFEKLSGNINQNIDRTVKTIANNDLALEEISDQLHNLSKSILEIEERSPMSSLGDVSLFNELSATLKKQNVADAISTNTTGTQTDTLTETQTDTNIQNKLQKKGEMICYQKTATQTDPEIPKKGEWRVFDGKSVWRDDWTTHDDNVKKKQQKISPSTTKRMITTSKKIKAYIPNGQQNRIPHNFYDFLTNFDHIEPPMLQNSQHRHQHRSRKSRKVTRRDKAPRPRKQHVESQEPRRQIQQQVPVQAPLYPNFQRGPIINQASPQPQRQVHQLVPVEVHRSPSPPAPPLPVNLPVHYQSQQQQPRFMDPLVPAVVQNTQISVSQEGRYALSRLRDVQLLKTVRFYLAYLHDKPSVCIDGLTGHHCKLLIGINGLPTDVEELKKIYVDFHCTFNMNFSPIEIENELKSFGSHLASTRINFLQNTNQNFKKFYNF
jgi:hypothetical protein